MKPLKKKIGAPKKIKKIVKYVERGIIIALIAMMAFLLFLATLELIYNVFLMLFESSENTLLVDLDNLLNVFGIFLLVLIGIELLDTIKVYFKENVIHVEVVILVALIAIARKVIVLDFEYYSGLEILGISAIIISLAAAYFLIKRAGSDMLSAEKFWEEKEITEKIPKKGDGEIVKKVTKVKRKAPAEVTDESEKIDPK
ncbi:MAG: hypothetical protein EA362_02750 [Saprospirales bacterium]|nr:MAG: hypothetical protein EA362_02750 [Saprospirales bacterium]